MSAGLSEPRSRMTRGKAADTQALGEAAHALLAAGTSAMTLRQLYYRLVSTAAIPKTEAGYNKLKRVMKDLREDGIVPWEWIVDHTRSVFRSSAWNGPEGVLASAAKTYRRQLMTEQKAAIQLWAESDSIGSVIAQVADEYTIPTFIGRGFAARGYLWAAAKDAVAARRAGKQIVILHVGDFDPSGEDIFRDVEETLRLYAMTLEWQSTCGRTWSVASSRAELRKQVAAYGWGTVREELEDNTAWLTVRRLALTPEQIESHELPARPPKKADPRTAKFTGRGVVEVEALPVEALLRVVKTAITGYIDLRALRVIRVAEASERRILKRIAATPLARLAEAAS